MNYIEEIDQILCIPLFFVFLTIHIFMIVLLFSYYVFLNREIGVKGKTNTYN